MWKLNDDEEEDHDKIAQNNLGIGRVASRGGRPTRLPHTFVQLYLFPSWRQCARPSNIRFNEPISLATLNSSLIGSAVFAHGRCYILPIRYTAPPQFSKNLPLPVGELHLHSSLCVPTQHITPNNVSMESAVFPQYTLVTNRPSDRQADRTTTVRIRCLRSYRAARSNTNNGDGLSWPAVEKVHERL